MAIGRDGVSVSMDYLHITTETIDVSSILREAKFNAGCADDECGAIVTFTGRVRGREGDGTISALEYEHYEGMAQAEMQRLAAEARERWTIRRLALVHRTGIVPVGEDSVVVIVAAGHRAEAFDAARFLIDELKKSVPIWKMIPQQGTAR